MTGEAGVFPVSISPVNRDICFVIALNIFMQIYIGFDPACYLWLVSKTYREIVTLLPNVYQKYYYISPLSILECILELTLFIAYKRGVYLRWTIFMIHIQNATDGSQHDPLPI